jgi:Lar family restriction alleviation protein
VEKKLEKLKPCPFCGQPFAKTEFVVRKKYKHEFAVCCQICRAKSRYCEHIEDAIAAWNQRASK